VYDPALKMCDGAAIVDIPPQTKYTVYFNANGGTDGANPPKAVESEAGKSITLPGQQTMVKDGFSFGGWNTSNLGSGTNYKAGDKYTVTATTNLYARWIPIRTIIFDGNGATSGDPYEPMKADSGTHITLPKNGTLARTGYSFGGWNTVKGGGINYKADSSYTVTGNATLYARWIPIYTLTFNGNNNTSGSAPTAMVVDSGTVVTLPGQGSIVRPGYSFGGWNTATSGGTNYKANASYTATGNATLYAKWTIINYTITYTLNDGTVTPANPTDYTIETTTFTLNTPSKTGYTFAGWTGSNGTTQQTSVSVALGSTGNKSYTANWTPITYAITYTLNDGTVTSANPTSYTVETPTFTLNTPNKTGYTFAGWTGSNGTTQQTSVSVALGSTGNKSYTANWMPTSYTITYTLNNGTVTPANPTSYTTETATFTLNNPTRACHTFSGWTGSNGTTKQTSVSIALGSTGDKNYTANWTVNTYTLTTTENPSGSGTFSRSQNQTSYDCGTNVQVTATANTGYVFNGWSGDASGTASSMTITMDKNKAVTANFVAVYTLTTNVNPIGGGTVSRNPNQDNYNAGASVTVTATAASGYVFSGWSGASTSTTNSISITMNGNKEVTATFYKVFTDNRNNKTYKTVEIGGKTWMAENLNYQPSSGSSWCYNNSADSCAKYGRLYDWNTAMAGKASSSTNPSGVQGVCPAGWHLPSDAEWNTLVTYAGGYDGKKLKSTRGWYPYSGITNEDTYGFSALPGGGHYSDDSFHYVGNFGLWWTATVLDSISAYGYGMRYDRDYSTRDYYFRVNGISVRCVGDD